jgi:hypothetical protein
MRYKVHTGRTLREVAEGGKIIRATVAEVLWQDDDREDRVGAGKPYTDATRWAELAVVKTAKGAILLMWAEVSCWQGERDTILWSGPHDKAKAAELLAAKAAEGNWNAEKALEDLDWWDGVAEEV